MSSTKSLGLPIPTFGWGDSLLSKLGQDPYLAMDRCSGQGIGACCFAADLVLWLRQLVIYGFSETILNDQTIKQRNRLSYKGMKQMALRSLGLIAILAFMPGANAQTGIIQEIGNADPGVCATTGQTFSIYNNDAFGTGSSYKARFLIGGKTRSKALLTKNSGAVGCLPYDISFFQQYTYSGVSGDDAVIELERFFNDISTWGGLSPLTAGDVRVAKYENTEFASDTFANLNMIVIVSLYRMTDGVLQGEMMMRYLSNGKLLSASLYHLWYGVLSDQDQTSLARPKVSGSYYGFLLLSKCASYLREGVTNSNSKRWWRRILLYDNNDMNEYGDQYNDRAVSRGCTLSYQTSTVMVQVWARHGNDNWSHPLEVLLGFWTQWGSFWYQPLNKASYKTSWGAEVNTISSYLPFRAIVDYNTVNSATTATAGNQDLYLPAEPVRWDGLAFKPIDSTVYGRIELYRYSFYTSSGCNRRLQTFVLDFYLASPSFLNSFFIKIFVIELYHPNKMVIYATVSSTEASRGTIGSTTNKLVAFEIERSYECFSTWTQWRSQSNGVTTGAMSGGYINTAFAANTVSSTGVQKKIRVWGRSCATGDGTNPCIVNGLGTYYGWQDDFIYMATTTQKFSTTDTTFMEGMIAHPAGSATDTNGGVTSILIASTRKHSSLYAQTVANQLLGADVFLSTNSHYVYDNQYMTGTFHIDDWGLGWNNLNSHCMDTSFQYSGQNNFYASRTDMHGQVSTTKFFQWPNASQSLTILTNKLSIPMATPQNTPNNWFQYGSMGGCHGQLPTYRFYTKVGFQDEVGNVPYLSNGWYDYSQGKWLFEPVTSALLFAKRVTYFNLYGEDTWNQGSMLNTGDFIAKYCVSSSVSWRYPETPNCIGVSTSTFYNSIHQLTEISGTANSEKFYWKTTGGATVGVSYTAAADVATRECGITDEFSVPPSLKIVTDISQLPVKYTQSQLAINSNWVNTVQKVNVKMLASDLSIYNSVPFTSNFFEVDNSAGQIGTTRTNQVFNLMVYQRECALIQSSPAVLWTDQTFLTNPLQAKIIALDVTFTNCVPSPPANSEAQTDPPVTSGTNLFIYGKDSGNIDMYDVSTKFTPVSPNLCAPTSYYLTDLAQTQYGTNNAATDDVYIDQTTNHLHQQTDGSFSGYDKVLWVTAKNLIGVTSRYPIRFKVCGSSQVISISGATGLTPPTPLKIVYGIGDNGGISLVRNTKPDFVNSDNTECPINNWYIENLSGTVYSANNDNTMDIYIDVLGNLRVQTLTGFAPFDKKVWITATNLGKAKGRYEIELKLCGAEILSSVLTSTPSYSYGPGDFSNLANEGDVRLNFKSSDSDCTVRSAYIETSPGTVLSTFNQNSANVYISSTFELRIKTNIAAYQTSYYVAALTMGNRLARYRIDIVLCGNEVASTLNSPPTYKELEWNSDQNGGYTGLYDIGIITTYFSTSIAVCPFIDFYVAQTTNTNVFAVNADTTKKVYVAANNHLYVQTNWPTAPLAPFYESFLIVGKTRGNKLVSFNINICLCGQETVNIVGTPQTLYTVGYNDGNGLANLANVASWFSSSTAPSRCGMIKYYIKNLDLSLFSAYQDSTKDVYIDGSNQLRVKSTATPFTLDAYIVGVSKGNKEKLYQVKIVLCGQETITLTSSAPVSPNNKYVYWWNQGSGLMSQYNVVNFFSDSSSICTISKYYIENAAIPTGVMYSDQNDITKDVYVDSSNVMKVQTNVNFAPFTKNLWVTALTIGRAKQSFPISVKVCGAEITSVDPSVATSTQVYAYGPEDGTASIVTIANVKVLFSSDDQTDCPYYLWYLENPDGTLYTNDVNGVGKDVFIDAAGNLKARTYTKASPAPYDLYLMVTAQTRGNVKAKYQIRVKLCGAEQVTLDPSTSPKLVKIYARDEESGLGNLGNVVPKFHQTDITLCPIQTYFLEYSNGVLFSSQNDATKNVYIDNTNVIRAHTSSPFPGYDHSLFVTALTKGNIKQRYEIRVKVCNLESVTVNPSTYQVTYIRTYGESSGLYQTAENLQTLLQSTDNAECPITDYYLTVSPGGAVFASNNDVSKKVYVDSTYKLMMHTVSDPVQSWAPYNIVVYVTAITKGKKINQYYARLKVCGAETLTPSIVPPMIPKFLLQYNWNAGLALPGPSLQLNNFTTSDNECPVVDIHFDNDLAGLSLYSAMNDATIDIYVDNTFNLRAHTIKDPTLTYTWAPYDKTKWLVAKTKGSITARYQVNIKVCGAETFINLNQQTKYVYAKNAQPGKIYASIFKRSSDPECPIVAYSMFDQLTPTVYTPMDPKLSNYQLAFVGASLLTVQTSIAYNVKVYVKSVTNAGVFDYTELQIKVCGLESITVTQLTQPSFYYQYVDNQPAAVAVADLLSWFNNDDAVDCPINQFLLYDADWKPYQGQISISSSRELKVVRSGNILKEFYVKVLSIGQEFAWQKFKVQICGNETITLSQPQLEIWLDIHSGLNDLYILKDFMQYFRHNDTLNCPYTEFSLWTLQDKKTFMIYQGQILVLDSKANEILIRTSKFGSETAYIKAVSKGGIYTYFPVMVGVCGDEVLTYQDSSNNNQIKFSFVQHTGLSNLQFIQNFTYLSKIKSSNPNCKVNGKLTQLLVLKDQKIETYANISRVEFDISNGIMRVNTSESYMENLILQVSTNSSQPLQIPLLVNITSKPSGKNFAPYFWLPGPTFYDWTVYDDQQIYEFVMDVGKQYDDGLALKWLNFSNSFLGTLQYKYDQFTQRADFYDKSENSVFEYDTYTYKLKMRVTGGFREMSKYTNGEFRIYCKVQDVQGLESTKLILLNIKLEDSYLRDKVNKQQIKQEVIEFKNKTIATVKHISVFGEVDIEFNQSSNFKPKNFTAVQIQKLKSKIQCYIKPSDNWTEYRDQNVQSLNFTFEVREFTNSNLRLKINFTDPTAVSPLSRYDKLVIFIEDLSDFFTNYVSRRQLQNSTNTIVKYQLYMEMPIQKQMYDQPSQREYVEKVYILRQLLTILCLVSLCISIKFRSPLDRMIQLLVELQVIANFSLLHVTLPGNVEIFNTIFKQFVQLNFFTPLDYNFVGKKVSKESATESLEFLGQRMMYNYDTYNVMFNLKTLGIIFLVFVAKVLLLGVMYAIMKFNQRTWPKEKKKDFIWMGKTIIADFFTLFMIGFIEFGTATVLSLQAPKDDVDSKSLVNQVITYLILVTLNGIIPGIFLYMFVKQKFTEIGLSSLENSNKKSEKNLQFKFLFVFFIVRYVFLSVALFVSKNWVQILTLILVFGLSLCYFAYSMPFSGKWNNRLGVFNLAMVLVCSYHLLCFTDFVERDQQYTMGSSFVICITILIGVNLLYFSRDFMICIYFFAYNFLPQSVLEGTRKRLDKTKTLGLYYTDLIKYKLDPRNKTPMPQHPFKKVWAQPQQDDLIYIDGKWVHIEKNSQTTSHVLFGGLSKIDERSEESEIQSNRIPVPNQIPEVIISEISENDDSDNAVATKTKDRSKSVNNKIKISHNEQLASKNNNKWFEFLPKISLPGPISPAHQQSLAKPRNQEVENTQVEQTIDQHSDISLVHTGMNNFTSSHKLDTLIENSPEPAISKKKSKSGDKNSAQKDLKLAKKKKTKKIKIQNNPQDEVIDTSQFEVNLAAKYHDQSLLREEHEKNITFSEKGKAVETIEKTSSLIEAASRWKNLQNKAKKT